LFRTNVIRIRAIVIGIKLFSNVIKKLFRANGVRTNVSRLQLMTSQEFLDVHISRLSSEEGPLAPDWVLGKILLNFFVRNLRIFVIS
jgi:hypothetical protein